MEHLLYPFICAASIFLAWFVLDRSQWLRVCQDLSVFQRERFQPAIDSGCQPDPQAAASKVSKYIHSCGAAVVDPADLQTERSGGVPWVTGARIVASSGK